MKNTNLEITLNRVILFLGITAFTVAILLATGVINVYSFSL